ncbi:glutaminase kidney isoform, mitochondrial-like isoform X2 [Tigriopus californicus]|uniref:glutaminase kidney isoform, mitochondrial-like isoform X2 n=1 Tax=Tigriopus californicus TaxID=6832 RepID=UPI0027D9F72F|nr:glutaminase kidney isoform, mitochondrial-like isoform X2 [Tigriopus californicus]
MTAANITKNLSDCSLSDMVITSQYQYNVCIDLQNSTNGNQQTNFANVEDMLFEVFCSEDSDSIDGIAIGHFLKALESTGLRRSDPRLKEMIQNLEKFQAKDETNDFHKIVIDRKEFKEIIISNIVLISRALRRQFIIPDFEDFTRYFDEFYHKAKEITTGKVADYIPVLAKQDPNIFGVSLCTIDGQRYSLGDAQYPFTLQSCCKPLNYAIALNELGAEIVHQYVGQEPSGGKFNAIELDYTNKPYNPMVNAGSIVVNSLLQCLMKPEMSMAEKFDYVNNYIKRLSGGEFVGFNNSVFLAEKEVSDRNYAMTYYMKEHNCFPKGINPKDCLDFWYQCCSMEVNCETVAVIAATLANGGRCPITREEVIQPEAVRDVMSLLHSCGFYEYSGQFAFKIGLPGKSSVVGAMMMVLPNSMGMCIYSPQVDQFGNSCRGLAFCEELVKVFNFHRYDNTTRFSSKFNPRRVLYESKGDTIVSMIYAAANGDMSNLRRHMFLGHDMGISDFDGRTALHLAAANGHLECVQFLLQSCNVDPEPTDRWGFTPLSEAERGGNKAVSGFLQHWIARDGNGDTLTARSGRLLLQQIKNEETEAKLVEDEVKKASDRQAVQQLQ